MDEEGLGAFEGGPDGRASASYVRQDGPFVITDRSRSANGQYANMYFTRLAKLRQQVLEQMRERWGALPQSKTLDVAEGAECVVLGTIYMDLKAKPSALEEYTRDPLAPPVPPPARYRGADTDRVFLEDEAGRLGLAGEALASVRLVTGVVCAVRGKMSDAGDVFEVRDVCFPGIAPQPPLPPSVSLEPADAEPRADDTYVALVSGIVVGGDSDGGHVLALQLLLDYVAGHIGGGADLSLQKRTVRVVVAGGLVGLAEGAKAGLTEPSKPMRVRAQKTLANSLQQLEAMLTPVAATTPVDLMPGAGDPCNITMPQQPLHPCLLPVCHRYPAFASVTNPHAFELAGVRMLGTSGQPVADALKYAQAEGGEADSIGVLEDMLNWRHIAPSAPDTLPCFPFATTDPFITVESPHVFFAGNQPKYGTKLVRGPAGQVCRLVAVPAFSSTQTAVLLNLRTLRCHPITFDGLSHLPP